MARLTLAEQIAQLDNTAPTDYDPEDIYNASGEPRNAEKRHDDEIKDPHAGREHYLEVGPSSLRKLQDGTLLDSKYEGMRTSRSKLFKQDEDAGEHSSEDAINDYEDSAHAPSAPLSVHRDSFSSKGAEDENNDEESEEDHDGTQDENESQQMSVKEKGETNALAVSLQRTRVAEKQKGKAVSQQLKIWDNLVDARIRLQKCVTATNKLPHPNVINSFTADQEVIHEFLSQALRLSEDILELRGKLLQETNITPPRKKRRIELDTALESENIDFEMLLQESTEEMMEFDAQTHLETLTILQKWSAKVQAVAPAVLLSSQKVSFKSGSGGFKSAGELVDEALRDPEKAIKRTWSKAMRIGGNPDDDAKDEEGDEETFDDRDFYQAMLRDVIETKGGKDDLYINSNRQKKSKKVDTKASKGRKLRYEPHEKLQNFMVPIPVREAWHDEQIDELFASLLGKGFNGAQTNTAAQEEAAVPLQGLKIFG